jgi:alkylated DNA repair dioxygenase AlkB
MKSKHKITIPIEDESEEKSGQQIVSDLMNEIDLSEKPFPCPYEAGFVPKVEADNLLAILEAFPKNQKIIPEGSTPPVFTTPTWQRITGRLTIGVFDDPMTPTYARAYVDAYGDKGSPVFHRSAMPPELQKLWNDVKKKHGPLCYIYMNYYASNKVPITMHADREDIGTLYPIVTISLGAERPWNIAVADWTTSYPKPVPGTIQSRKAEHGSCLVMPAGFQETHLHNVPTLKEECGVRISLTFRNPVEHKTKVVNVRKEPFEVYMGRGKFKDTKGMWHEGGWGNPFSDKPDSKAEFIVKPEEVMPKFRAWFENRIRTEQGYAAKVMGLHGKTLGCYCWQGKPCHARVIASWADLIAAKWNELKPVAEKMREWLKQKEIVA